jgi:hypothetical protein
MFREQTPRDFCSRHNPGEMEAYPWREKLNEAQSRIAELEAALGVARTGLGRIAAVVPSDGSAEEEMQRIAAEALAKIGGGIGSAFNGAGLTLSGTKQCTATTVVGATADTNGWRLSKKS